MPSSRLPPSVASSGADPLAAGGRAGQGRVSERLLLQPHWSPPELHAYAAAPQPPRPPAPMARDAAPVAATTARPVPTLQSPAASGRYGLFTLSISMSYSCREKGGREGQGVDGQAAQPRLSGARLQALASVWHGRRKRRRRAAPGAQQPPNPAPLHLRLAWLMPTMQMFMSRAEERACR